MLGNDYKLRESQDMTRNSQAFWILITGFHRMIHYLLVFFTVESYLVLPSYISLTPRNEGTIKMEYKGEPLPEKIPWEGEFTLRSDP